LKIDLSRERERQIEREIKIEKEIQRGSKLALNLVVLP
jgi:hypothetical protein